MEHINASVLLVDSQAIGDDSEGSFSRAMTKRTTVIDTFAAVFLFIILVATSTPVSLNKASALRTGTFSGFVRVEILGMPTKEGVGAEVDTFNLDTGRMKKSFEKPQRQQLSTGSHVESCSGSSRAESPNGKLVAYCSLEYISIPTLHVVDADGKSISTIPLQQQDREVSGFSWSPDSTAIVVLTRTQRRSWTPGDLLVAFLGLSLSYSELKLYCYSLSGERLETGQFFNSTSSGDAFVTWPSGGTLIPKSRVMR